MKNKINYEFERRIREIEDEAINKIKLAEKTYLVESSKPLYNTPTFPIQNSTVERPVYYTNEFLSPRTRTIVK
jgi:hypothetical protein